MRIAILDLGTNTFNIFIAETQADRSFRKIYKSKIAVKLGEGGIGRNHIEPIPFQRGINALKQHLRTCKKYEVEQIHAFATSAIRSADNGPEFVKQAWEKARIRVQPISGDREAELIYNGVRAAVPLNDKPSLIMDIGGGSTEFILADTGGIRWKQSFQLGAARLLERFRPSDPIRDEEIKTIEKYLEESLTSLFDAVGVLGLPEGGLELIGSSGSFDSLAEMIGYHYYGEAILKGKTAYTFQMSDLEKIHQLIINSTTEERRHMQGLTPMRVDMIVVSTLIVNFIIRKFRIRELRLSRYSLKEGALCEWIEKQNGH